MAAASTVSRAARGNSITSPDQGDGDEKRQGKPAGLTQSQTRAAPRRRECPGKDQRIPPDDVPVLSPKPNETDQGENDQDRRPRSTTDDGEQSGPETGLEDVVRDPTARQRVLKRHRQSESSWQWR